MKNFKFEPETNKLYLFDDLFNDKIIPKNLCEKVE